MDNIMFFLSKKVLPAVIVIIFFILGILKEHFFPSYAKEKAKNLATKEDIKEITEKTEEVKVEFSKALAEHTNKMKLNNEYLFKQFVELYSPLYAMVCQSEYLRFSCSSNVFKSHLVDNVNIVSVVDFPFFEIHKEKETTSINSVGIQSKVEQITDEITMLTKINLCKRIIESPFLASNELLKLAYAYQFVHYNYTKNGLPEDVKKYYVEQELLIIRKIIVSILKDYNRLAKIFDFNYNDKELNEGIFDDSVYI